MDNNPHKTLQSLLSLPAESEVVEFKTAKDNYDFDKLGSYFSALSNEANLRNKPCAWLVFGIEPKNHKIVGTNYRPDSRALNSLKHEIAEQTSIHLTFLEIHELATDNGRVVMFQIPPAPKGIPVAFKEHYYGRDGESLVGLSMDKLNRILSQSKIEDWSAGIVEDASLEDLDPEAISVARTKYKTKFPNKSAEVDSWNDVTFLNKARLTVKGKITRTAIILLGKEESEHFISPAQAKIRWVLKDSKGNERDYQFFSCPFLPAVDKVYAKIRNLKYRYLKEGTLFPEEVDMYDPYVIREAVNNCIAHQDYTQGGMINVVEYDDYLVFSNKGSFIPGNVEQVIRDNSPEEQQRNRFLSNAMRDLDLVDIIGSGIRKMFESQRKRFFPLPDYEISDNRVKVIITGKILDPQYTKLLAQKSDLSLDDIILLDKVQKKQKITAEEVKHLKQKKLIEGRLPNYFIAKTVAQQTDKKADYTKNKAFDTQQYIDWIIQEIKHHGSVTRKEIDALLSPMLPNWMSEKQKVNKIRNLIAKLSEQDKIKNIGNKKSPQWVLSVE